MSKIVSYTHPKSGEVFDCWLCPACDSPTSPIMEYVGGRGFIPHIQCSNPHCMERCSEEYMIKNYGLCGAAQPKPRPAQPRGVHSPKPAAPAPTLAPQPAEVPVPALAAPNSIRWVQPNVEAMAAAAMLLSGFATICPRCRCISEIPSTPGICKTCDALGDREAEKIADAEYARHATHHARY